jgi:hypothetical protein
MYTCIHAYMHTCIHAYMHTCIHAYMHTCIHIPHKVVAVMHIVGSVALSNISSPPRSQRRRRILERQQGTEVLHTYRHPLPLCACDKNQLERSKHPYDLLWLSPNRTIDLTTDAAASLLTRRINFQPSVGLCRIRNKPLGSAINAFS